MKIISKITNFVREYQNYIIIGISAFIIESALFGGIFISTSFGWSFLLTAAAILFPTLLSFVYIDYNLSKSYSEYAEREYDLAKQVNDLTFEHMGSAINHINSVSDIVKERCQNMRKLAESYMIKSQADMEYNNEQITNIMESLKIIAKELDKKNN